MNSKDKTPQILYIPEKADGSNYKKDIQSLLIKGTVLWCVDTRFDGDISRYGYMIWREDKGTFFWYTLPLEHMPGEFQAFVMVNGVE